MDREQAVTDWINEMDPKRRREYLDWLKGLGPRKREWIELLWPPVHRDGLVPCRRRCSRLTDSLSQVCSECRHAYWRERSDRRSRAA